MKSTGRRRREETITSRLRFGHTGLNSKLFISGKHCNGKSEYCGDDDTVQHVILHCQDYEEKQRHLIQNLIKLKLDLSDLL